MKNEFNKFFNKIYSDTSKERYFKKHKIDDIIFQNKYKTVISENYHQSIFVDYFFFILKKINSQTLKNNFSDKIKDYKYQIEFCFQLNLLLTKNRFVDDNDKFLYNAYFIMLNKLIYSLMNYQKDQMDFINYLRQLRLNLIKSLNKKDLIIIKEYYHKEDFFVENKFYIESLRKERNFYSFMENLIDDIWESDFLFVFETYLLSNKKSDYIYEKIRSHWSSYINRNSNKSSFLKALP